MLQFRLDSGVVLTMDLVQASRARLGFSRFFRYMQSVDADHQILLEAGLTSNGKMSGRFQREVLGGRLDGKGLGFIEA